MGLERRGSNFYDGKGRRIAYVGYAPDRAGKTPVKVVYVWPGCVHPELLRASHSSWEQLCEVDSVEDAHLKAALWARERGVY